MKRLGVVVALLVVARTAAAAAPGATSCTLCHLNVDLTGETSREIVERERVGAHAAAGISCHDCHGGDPDPALADSLAAMEQDDEHHPFRGVPTRTEIPAFCGRCHSDPAFMKRYKPDARVDQEREYWTSRHGELLQQGDTQVATCVDCHGTHGILSPANTESPVYPKQVAETCSKCHSDERRMAGYRLADGRPFPVDQYARWRRSVHASYLLAREDLSAPTCNDCHGNHGATPPGLDSIAFVCGQCHGREAELFRASPKKAGFDRHRQFLEAAGAEGCAACHEGAPAELAGRPISFSQCTACHGNHDIVRATIAMLAPLPDTPCEFCHESAVNDEGGEASKRIQSHYERTRESLLEQARTMGLEGTARFDWLVDQALALPAHSTRSSREAGGPQLRPEFRLLFTKFRIGKTRDAYEEPGGGPVGTERLRCSDCHAPGSVGAETAKTFIEDMRQLTTATARAERLWLAARRGGVEVREVAPHVDAAVAAQIELEVLVHTFSDAPDGAFVAKYGEGSKHARAAQAGARKGLDELAVRRRGLFVFLGLLALVLIAMVLKVRSLSREDS